MADFGRRRVRTDIGELNSRGEPFSGQDNLRTALRNSGNRASASARSQQELIVSRSCVGGGSFTWPVPTGAGPGCPGSSVRGAGPGFSLPFAPSCPPALSVAVPVALPRETPGCSSAFRHCHRISIFFHPGRGRSPFCIRTRGAQPPCESPPDGRPALGAKAGRGSHRDPAPARCQRRHSEDSPESTRRIAGRAGRSAPLPPQQPVPSAHRQAAHEVPPPGGGRGSRNAGVSVIPAPCLP